MEECEHKAICFNQSIMAFQCLICGEKLIKVASIDEYKLFCRFADIDPQMILRN